MKECYRFRISGRVQGVFYRASTRQKASQLGLVGWVRNRRDGGVEVLACGSNERLRELEAWLWHGPEHASVSAVTREAATAHDDFSDFAVRATL